ncbi:DUF2232 domain-containing protein [Gracilibacillus xinjiangensis]|uniref:DUF2232 domain-containing protein n=1 Tax=Gracilibacillus xinjiangensis TaxID=1193282 RepID=A0ABV8WRC7_9BACI
MNEKTLNRKYFLYILLYIGILLVTVFVPFLQLLTIMLLPIPVVLLLLRYHRSLFLLAIGIVTLFSFIVFPVLSLPNSLIAILGGTMIGFSMKKRQHPYETWSKGTMGFLLGLVGVYAYVEAVLGISIREVYTNTMDESLQMTEQIIQMLGVSQLSAEDLNLIREQMLAFLQLLPVVLVVVSMVIAIITQWLCYKWINHNKEEKYSFPPFRKFQLPKLVLWIYFLTLIFSLFSGDSGFSQMILLNVSNLAGILLILQGLSFVFHYSYVKAKSKALPVISILVVIFFPVIGLYLMRILGIIDLGFELKKRVSE